MVGNYLVLQAAERGKEEIKLFHTCSPLWECLETLSLSLICIWTMILLDETSAETVLTFSAEAGLLLPLPTGPYSFPSPTLCLLFWAEFYPPKIHMLVEVLTTVHQKVTIFGDEICKELIKDK